MVQIDQGDPGQDENVAPLEHVHVSTLATANFQGFASLNHGYRSSPVPLQPKVTLPSFQTTISVYRMTESKEISKTTQLLSTGNTVVAKGSTEKIENDFGDLFVAVWRPSISAREVSGGPPRAGLPALQGLK